MESGVINAGPFIGVISTGMMWVGLIVVLAMFKKFISHGISIAVGEFLLRSNDDDIRQKVARWFANGDDVLAVLDEINEKTERKTK